MVEIALAVAIIAFALVALIGLLPLGMETQRDNRQDTIVNLDGTYLLEAIRGRVAGTIDLLDYVDQLSKDGATVPRTSSEQIVQTLRSIGTTNRALVRSIAGAAALRSPEAREMAMRYLVTCVIRRADDPPSLPTVADLPYRDPLATNLYTVRLVIEWPVLPTGQLALDSPNRQVFRTVVAGVESNGVLTTLFQ